MLKCVYCEQELIHQQATGEYLCQYCNTSFACDNGTYNFLRDESETQESYPEEAYDRLFQLESGSSCSCGTALTLVFDAAFAGRMRRRTRQMYSAMRTKTLSQGTRS